MTETIRKVSTKAQYNNGKSFLKWVGGKTRYSAQLVDLAPNFPGRYFEPFMGSAAVFFELNPKMASLSDANPDLVICFQQVAQHPEKLMELLDGMPNTRDDFLKIRSQDVAEMSDLERAARVIYLNKTAFRGMWRVNRKGQYNVPYGEYDRPYYNPRTMLAASASLKNTDIRCIDFSEAMEAAREGDWIYLDPPYIPLGGWSDFKRYTLDQFHEEDHQRLAQAMRDASERGVFVTLSNSNTETTRKIYADFPFVSMATRRDINLNSKGRTSEDLVFTNYDIPELPNEDTIEQTLF